MRVFWVCMMALCLASCGFTPMYGKNNEHTPASVELEKISITTGRGSLAALLKAELEKDLNPSGHSGVSKAYTLQAGLSQEKIPVVINPDASVNRFNINLNSPYVLTRSADGTIIKKGTLRKILSYNVVDSDFSTYVSEQDVVRRGIEELSEDYRLMLNGHFHTIAR